MLGGGLPYRGGLALPVPMDAARVFHGHSRRQEIDEEGRRAFRVFDLYQLMVEGTQNTMSRVVVASVAPNLTSYCRWTFIDMLLSSYPPCAGTSNA